MSNKVKPQKTATWESIVPQLPHLKKWLRGKYNATTAESQERKAFATNIKAIGYAEARIIEADLKIAELQKKLKNKPDVAAYEILTREHESLKKIYDDVLENQLQCFRELDSIVKLTFKKADNESQEISMFIKGLFGQAITEIAPKFYKYSDKK